MTAANAIEVGGKTMIEQMTFPIRLSTSRSFAHQNNELTIATILRKHNILLLQVLRFIADDNNILQLFLFAFDGFVLKIGEQLPFGHGIGEIARRRSHVAELFHVELGEVEGHVFGFDARLIRMILGLPMV